MSDATGAEPLIAGRYRLGSRLGRGGMAEVYDAFDERLQRRVALKVLRPEVAVDAGMRQRFEGEARAAARLSHPSVVMVYDSGEHAGRAFLVMERLPGETLADRIRRGPVDQDWLKTVAFDVLAALGAAHDIGLIHRDIKPGNVLITEDGRAKVADFGIAKMTDAGGPDSDLTAVGMVLGTPAYLAPERLAGHPATVTTDLYALGVVLYEAAAGHKPIAGALDATVVGTGAVAPGAADVAAVAPGIDPGLARIIRRSMAPRAQDRYPSAEAMAADLRRGGAGEVAPTVAMAPTVARPAPTTIMAAEPAPATAVLADRDVPAATNDARGGRGGLIAVIVALLVVIAIVIVLLVRSSSPGSSPSSTTVGSTSTTVASTTSSSSSTTATTAPTTTASTVPSTTATTAPSTTVTTEPTTTSTPASSTTSSTTATTATSSSAPTT